MPGSTGGAPAFLGPWMRESDLSIRTGSQGGAVFDAEGTYRYLLWRVWDSTLPCIGFVLCNPSTADENHLDPTLRRCVAYAQRWGFGSMLIGNLFAFRSTDPDRLFDAQNPVGPRNDEFLSLLSTNSEKVIAGWGTWGAYRDRGFRVMGQVLRGTVAALGFTKAGHHPRHPLYLPSDVQPIDFRAEEIRPFPSYGSTSIRSGGIPT